MQLLYIAKRLKEALRLEELLTKSGVDYVVEPDKYHGGIIFRSERVGAFFYVEEDSVNATRELMARAGFNAYKVDESDPR